MQNLIDQVIGNSDLGYESYDVLGREALEKVKKLISDEGITLKEGFSDSVLDRSSYIKLKKLTKNGYEKSNIISYPKFTDKSDMIIAITLAHELGHHFIHRDKESKSKLKKIIIDSNIPLLVYQEEKWAWKEAEEILKKLNIITDRDYKNKSLNFKDLPDGEEGGYLAIQDFYELKSYSLNTYKQRSLLTEVLTFVSKNVVKPIFSIYIFLGLITVFANNDIPPFHLLNLEPYGALNWSQNIEFFINLLIAIYGVVMVCKIVKTTSKF